MAVAFITFFSNMSDFFNEYLNFKSFKSIFIGNHSNEFWQGSIFFLNEIKHEIIPLWFLLITY